MAKKGKAKKKKPVTRQPHGDSKSVKKKRRKKKKLQKYQAPVPTKDTAMPIQSDSDANNDSSSGETKPEKIQKLLEPYTRYQRVNFLVGAAVPDVFLFTRPRDAADRDISRRKFVVYGLAWDTTRETLVSAFESCIETEDCNVIFDRVKGKTKGYSFVQFKTRLEAAKALKQPRKKIRPIIVLPPADIKVIYCELTEAEKDFYEALFKRSKVKFDQFVEQGRVLHTYASILELLLRLRQCCDHPFLVMSRGDTQEYSDLNKLAKQFLKVDREVVAQVGEISVAILEGTFVNWLKPKIRTEVKVLRPSGLLQIMETAQRIEDKIHILQAQVGPGPLGSPMI